VEENTNKIINNLEKLKAESPEYSKLVRLFEHALKQISPLDTKAKDLLNIVLSMFKQPPDTIRSCIKTAFNDGVHRDDIIVVACLALVQLDQSDKPMIESLIDSISKYDPVTKFRSDCYWYDN